MGRSANDKQFKYLSYKGAYLVAYLDKFHEKYKELVRLS